MPQKSLIEWCTHTSNAIRYVDKKTGKRTWRCVKTSPGCKHCYAEARNKRFGDGRPFTKANLTHVDCELNEKELGKILRMRGKGIILFHGDMTDYFGEWVPGEYLDKLFAVMALTPHITHVVLTKRAERMAEYCDRTGDVIDAMSQIDTSAPEVMACMPLPNAIVGTSIEDQATADARLPHLGQLGAAGWRTMVSAEPAVAAIDLAKFIGAYTCYTCGYRGFDTGDNDGCPECGTIRGDGFGDAENDPRATTIGHLVVGGESGPGARPCNIEWIRSLVQQAKAAEARCFVKQLGANPYIGAGECKVCGNTPEDDEIGELRHGKGCYVVDEDGGGESYESEFLDLKHPKGADPSEWPEDLRVREPLMEAAR